MSVKKTELATNFPHESDTLVSSSLVLLALETMVKIALSPMVSSSSSASNKYDCSVSMSPDSFWKIAVAAEVFEQSK